MISPFLYIPSMGMLFAHGTQSLAAAVTPATPAEPPAHPPAMSGELKTAHSQPSNGLLNTHTIKLMTTPGSASSHGMNIDHLAKLTQSDANLANPHLMTAVEIVNSPDVQIKAPVHGLVSSGLTSVWLDNRGGITGATGTGVKLDGNKADEVTNQGVITGGNGVALDMGGGDDLLIIKKGSRFNGEVDGGSGTNQVILDDAEGGTFEGATRMQHLWVGKGSWELTGALHANRQGKMYSDATLINRSGIKGTMDIEPGASYSGGNVDNLNVAGTLLLDPAITARTRITNDLNLKPGSSVNFKIGVDQQHSVLNVGNTLTLGNPTLHLDVQPESDELLKRQLPIAKATTIDGRFGAISSNLTTLEPELIYTPKGIFVEFKRKESPAITA